jgi:hypothetical protein
MNQEGKFNFIYTSIRVESSCQTVQGHPFSQNVFTVLIQRKNKSLHGIKPSPSKHQLNHVNQQHVYRGLASSSSNYFHKDRVKKLPNHEEKPEGQQVSPVHPQPVKNRSLKKDALGREN